MRKHERFFFVFFILLLASLTILILSLVGKLKFASSILENTLSPVGIKVYGVLQKLPFVAKSEEQRRLKDKNLDLLVDFSEAQRLKKENAALKDQFQTYNPRSYDLLPAKIVGAPGFIPGKTTPSDFVIDKGERDGVKEGQAVVFKNNLVGRVKKASSYLSKVELIFNSSSLFTAKTATKNVSGIVKSHGKEITLDNVLLSDKIEVGDIVVTKGDLNLEGIGYAPDITVGRIKSIDKNPSSLFQKARVESFVDFNSLDMVFILRI